MSVQIIDRDLPPGAATRRALPALMTALIFACVFTAFIPALSNDFLNWDDDRNFLFNDRWRGLGPEQVKWMFTAFHMGHYQPITWLTLGFDYLWGGAVFGEHPSHGYGMDPRAFHLTNVIFHAVNAVLIYLVGLRLLSWALTGTPTSRAWPIHLGAAAGALIFGVHPLRVESVAWVTERRDLVSAFFVLLMLLAYLRAADAGRNGQRGSWRRWWVVAWALYVISLMSKVSVVPFVAVLLILDWYPLRRLNGPVKDWFRPPRRSVWLEKIPFLLVAMVFATIALAGQSHIQTLAPLERHPLAGRIAQSLYGLVFYAAKTIAPHNLLPIYELHMPVNPIGSEFVVAAVIVFGASVAIFLLRRRTPALVAASLCYAAILGPVLGLFQNGPQIVADRYSYLSTIGLIMCAAGAVAGLWRRPRHRHFAGVVGVVSLVTMVFLGSLTWRQCAVWRSNASFWRCMIEHDPGGAYANNGYGLILFRDGKVDESIPYFREAIRINPMYDNGHLNLWEALRQKNMITELAQALEIGAQSRHSIVFAGAHWRLGILALEQRDFEQAIGHFEVVLLVNPDDLQAHTGLGIAYGDRREYAKAVEHFEKALRINPHDAQVQGMLNTAREALTSQTIAPR